MKLGYMYNNIEKWKKDLKQTREEILPIVKNTKIFSMADIKKISVVFNNLGLMISAVSFYKDEPKACLSEISGKFKEKGIIAKRREIKEEAYQFQVSCKMIYEEALELNSKLLGIMEYRAEKEEN